MRLAILISVLIISAGLAVGPGSRPRVGNPGGFLHGFRIAHYLEAAVELQKLQSDARTAKLKELAADEEHGAEIFVLCRMLFEAKAGGEFRRPLIGGPSFIDGGKIADWPLEPIALQHNVPILVATTYRLGGEAETPVQYLDYCLAECEWREVKYEVLDKAKIKQEVEDFIAAHPKIRPEGAEMIREQAQ